MDLIAVFFFFYLIAATPYSLIVFFGIVNTDWLECNILVTFLNKIGIDVFDLAFCGSNSYINIIAGVSRCECKDATGCLDLLLGETSNGDYTLFAGKTLESSINKKTHHYETEAD